jgi:hypothetical protein
MLGMLGTVGVSVSMNRPPRFRFRIGATSSSPAARQCTQTPPSDSTREWIFLEGEVCRCPGSYRPGWPSRCGLSVANQLVLVTGTGFGLALKDQRKKRQSQSTQPYGRTKTMAETRQRMPLIFDL